MPMIEAVMADASAAFSDLERVAVCTGPGSFTGIRIGIAVARGIALGLDIPSVGVSRFEALTEGNDTVRLPGRGGVVYAQDFSEGRVMSEPRIEEGTTESRLADPVTIARLALLKDDLPRPAPLYLRDANAALPSEGPPRILD